MEIKFSKKEKAQLAALFEAKLKSVEQSKGKVIGIWQKESVRPEYDFICGLAKAKGLRLGFPSYFTEGFVGFATKEDIFLVDLYATTETTVRQKPPAYSTVEAA